jgi:hypothetical protein
VTAGVATARDGYAQSVTSEPRRAPDPFRPGEVPEGKPFAKAGRPITPMLVVAAIAAVVAALLLFALVR